MARLTHEDRRGKARMVDVGAKHKTRRRAVARGRVRFNAKAFRALEANRLAKGDALGVARIAGIQAAKRTAEWIPLCHDVPLDHLDVTIELDGDERLAVVTGEASAVWNTGVEMEALVAVHAACLALYDMAKGLDRGIEIESIVLQEKTGGRSGAYRRRGRTRR
ncbi:MAG: cyclic pyranopterin monophosphate synthase MoaC [Acidobacteria bacterium]|nr:cyclic pyranopterin monophosphate synthase MoaC [Acidobacteriota bacterium]